jgi:hypothetical protein
MADRGISGGRNRSNWLGDGGKMRGLFSIYREVIGKGGLFLLHIK